MLFDDAIKNRRSVYDLNSQIPVFPDKVMDVIRNSVEYVPDAFNMHSQRVAVIIGGKHKEFWNMVYNELVRVSGGRFSREKIDSFARGYGTILYFYDKSVVESTKKKYPTYAHNFHDWVMQSNGMLQFTIWTGLRTLGIGANLQHYSPVIDNMTREMFDLSEDWVMVAQMPFGGIVTDAGPRKVENTDGRIIIFND